MSCGCARRRALLQSGYLKLCQFLSSPVFPMSRDERMVVEPIQPGRRPKTSLSAFRRLRQRWEKPGS